ncbi:MAG: hypothetical protein WCP19_00235 [Chloroflexota bacterium]
MTRRWSVSNCGNGLHLVNFFGIPFSNFAGWFVAAFMITYFADYHDSQYSYLFLICVVTLLIETIGLVVFRHQPVAALFGFSGMGIFAFLVFVKQKRLSFM